MTFAFYPWLNGFGMSGDKFHWWCTNLGFPLHKFKSQIRRTCFECLKCACLKQLILVFPLMACSDISFTCHYLICIPLADPSLKVSWILGWHSTDFAFSLNSFPLSTHSLVLPGLDWEPMLCVLPGRLQCIHHSTLGIYVFADNL